MRVSERIVQDFAAAVQPLNPRDIIEQSESVFAWWRGLGKYAHIEQWNDGDVIVATRRWLHEPEIEGVPLYRAVEIVKEFMKL